MIDLGEQPDGWVYFTELVFIKNNSRNLVPMSL